MSLDGVVDRLIVETAQENGGDPHDLEGVALLVPASGMPRAKVLKAGVEVPKTVSLLQLLQLLDRSTVLDALRLPPHRTSHAPPLPPRTMLFSTIDFPEDVEHVLTAWMPPARYPFTLQDENATTTHMVPMPPIVYRAHLRAGDGRLKSLCLTLAPELREEDPPDAKLKTPLYRYPFSNVFGEYGGVLEVACWPTIEKEQMALAELPRKAVHAFLSIPNTAHLYGAGTSHNAPHHDYRALVEDVEAGGLNPDWLIPARLDVAGLHHQQRKEGVA